MLRCGRCVLQVLSLSRAILLADENVDLMFDLGCVGMIVSGLVRHKGVRLIVTLSVADQQGP